MQGFSTLKNAIDYLLSTGIVTKVYTDVLIIEDNNTRYPAYRDGEEFIFVGIDDTKIMNCYIRQTAEAQTISSDFIGSSSKRYKNRAPFRFVFFNDYEERNFDELINLFTKLTLFEKIDLVKIITDKDQLLIAEANRNVKFGGRTFYIAIDVNVTFYTEYDKCGESLECEKLPNPITGCIPIIIHSTDELDPVWNAQKYNYYTKTETKALFRHDELIGLNDGSNAIFTTPFDFIIESLVVYYRGQKLTLITDYTTTGTNTINFTFSPTVNSALSATYILNN